MTFNMPVPLFNALTQVPKVLSSAVHQCTQGAPPHEISHERAIFTHNQKSPPLPQGLLSHGIR